jgi:hypothetical protein
MATMYPDLSDSELNERRLSKKIQSDCEVILYRAFKHNKFILSALITGQNI